MNIPSETDCRRLLGEMGMLSHIVVHSETVCRVALFLVDRLNARGESLGRDLVRAAALLHDITKTRSFQTKENHAQTGAELLRKNGYPEVAEIVRQHVHLDAYRQTGSITEAEIVNYADKRVLHDRIVSLEERMAYILDAYGQNPTREDQIRWLIGQTRAMEARIFDRIGMAPEQLNP